MVTDKALLSAFERTGTYRAAAKACGMTYGSKFRARVQRLVINAGSPPPPEGFHAVQVSQDGDGNVRSVRSRPDPETPHRAPVPEGHEVAGLSTMYGEGGQVVAQWVKTRPALITHEDRIEALAAHLRDFKGSAWSAAPAPEHLDHERCNAFVWGDPHIGLLSHARETGKNFDLKIACADLRRSAELLVGKAPPAATALFLETGDLWHAESDKQTTPHGGNKLDVDGRKSKILEEGYAVTRGMLDLLLKTHERVIVAIVPGNHDPDQAIHTRLWLQAVYAGHDRIEILDNANPYIYWRWESNFFMMTHGDKRVKPQELGEIMLADRPLDVGTALHRRAFTGHVHHKNVAEFRTFRWESFNSLCAPDFWHHSEGYRSERLVECITFHSRFGEENRCRVTHQELSERRERA